MLHMLRLGNKVWRRCWHVTVMGKLLHVYEVIGGVPPRVRMLALRRHYRHMAHEVCYSSTCTAALCLVTFPLDFATPLPIAQDLLLRKYQKK